jgi:hypothetical protein
MAAASAAACHCLELERKAFRKHLLDGTAGELHAGGARVSRRLDRVLGLE